MSDAPGGDPVLDGLVRLGNELPFNRHLGVELVSLELGRASTRLRADQRIPNHLGGVHAVAVLAPAELAGALAVSSRLRGLLESGYVPVVGERTARYVAPARGELTATALVGPEAVEAARAAAEAGERPRAEVDVEVHDTTGPWSHPHA